MPAKKATTSRRDAKQIEAKHIGEETLDWSSVKEDDLMDTIMTNLRHYGYFYEQKTYVKWVEDWIREFKNSNNLLKQYKRAKGWRTCGTFAGLCRMELNGAPLPESCKLFQDNQLTSILSYAESDNVQQVEKTVVARKTPAEHLAEKTATLVGEIEYAIDEYFENTISKSYSLYNHLKKENSAAQSAREAMRVIETHKAEMEEVISGTSPDLVEAYSHLTKREKTKYLKFLNEMIVDLQKYLETKKAARKPRAKKEKPLIKQVEKVQYQKESSEYKVASISPVQIIGKHELYLFNTKTRVLKYLRSDRVDGFWIKGTTVQGFNEAESFKKKIRKPEEMLGTLVKSTKTKAQKYVKALSTNETEADGRINRDTIILKAF